MLFCLVTAGQVLAEPGDDAEDADDGRDQESMLDGVMDWLDRHQGGLSEQVAASALAIDRFFATEEYLEDTSESYLQLVTAVDYDTRDGFSGDVKLRGRLDLPGTKRRFSLLISGESDDPLAPLTDSSSQGALTLERNPREDTGGWQIRPGAGVRGGWPPDPFVQVRATRFADLGGGWATRTQASVRYLVDEKWDLRGDFNLVKIIDERWSGRARTELRWRDVDGYTTASQSFDLFDRVSRRQGIRHSIAVSADDETGWEIDSFGYRFTWRRLIHSDWLYLELSPELYFPSEDDFEAAAAVQLSLEAFAGRYR